MTGSDMVRDRASGLMATGISGKQISLARRLSGRLKRRLGQCATGISTGVLAVSVSVVAMAQGKSGAQFKTAPKSQGADGGGEDVLFSTDVILGIPVNTLFFIAAGVIAVLWFTVGGGRKPKITPRG